MKPQSLRKIFLCLALFFGVPARALDHDVQAWFQGVVQGPMSGTWRGYFEVQTRFTGNVSRLERLILRPAVFYAVSPELTLWLGGLVIPKTVSGTNRELRLWQQALYQPRFTNLTGVFRARFEERFLQNVDMGLRLRLMARGQFDLDAAGDLWLVVSDEIFLSLNTVSASFVQGFDQNRLFVGANYRVLPALRLESGIFFNYLNRPSGLDRLDFVPALMAIYNLP